MVCGGSGAVCIGSRSIFSPVIRKPQPNSPSISSYVKVDVYYLVLYSYDITVPLSLINTKSMNFSCGKPFFEMKPLIYFSSYVPETF